MNRQRHGTLLLLVLVSLLVVTLLLVSMLKATLMLRRQLRAESHLLQTEMLLQAGLERAAYRLRNEPGYQGENWALSPEDLTGDQPGQVTIQLPTNSDTVHADRAILAIDSQSDSLAEFDEPRAQHVEIVAEYPLGSVHSVRRTQQFQVTIQPPRTSEGEFP